MAQQINPLLRLSSLDNILIAKNMISAGEALVDPLSGEVIGQSKEVILPGHKVAAKDLPPGEKIIKYGEMIGCATTAIRRGDWVHVHNVERGNLNVNHHFCTQKPVPPHVGEMRYFQGYRRANGLAGTRNYIAVISTVNCSATTAKMVARQLPQDLLADYPNIDGIFAVTHPWGCAIEYGGEDHQQLARTLAGYAKHPNVAASVVVGLGCEAAHASLLQDNYGLVSLDNSLKQGIPTFQIQDVGGVKKTVARLVGVIKEILPEVAKLTRTEIPVSELILGTECGGSDGFSGITANPVIGRASDLLVAYGGTAILSEIPEIIGGEHLLTQRAVSDEVAQELLNRIQWWHDYTAKFGMTIDNNPSYGNKQGGLTTIYEKSLGAISKGGTTQLRKVYKYAEKVLEKGFVIMDTPGYDPASVTGLVAGGANLIVFSTGRGSCFGCKPVPSLKVTTNTEIYQRMIEDMDFDAGTVLQGASIDQVGDELFEELVLIASGKKTKSEIQGIGDEEFCPWHVGPIT